MPGAGETPMTPDTDPRQFAEYGRDTGAMTIVYVITYGDATHGTGIYGVTLDAEEAMYMAKEAEQHYHKCYGGPICEPRDWPNEGQWSREVFIREYKARPPGEQFDGDDTELRAVFGEPVEGRDFTRIDGSPGGIVDHSEAETTNNG